MKYFLNCIEHFDYPNPGGREGLVNMQIVEAAYTSSKWDKVIPIEPGFDQPLTINLDGEINKSTLNIFH